MLEVKIKVEKKDPPKKDSKGIKYLGGLLLSKMAMGGAANLRSNADEVNKLNVFPVPDGDTGDNMRMTVESGIAAIENLDTDDLAEVMKVLSHGMLLGARGNSGVILSQFFAGMAKGLENFAEADPYALGQALDLGVKQAYASVMTPMEGTILTVAREAVEYAIECITPQSTIRSFFADLVKEMHESLERTPEILSVLKEAGVVDSGGAGLLYIMEGFNRVLNGEELDAAIAQTAKETATAAQKVPSKVTFGPDSEMTYGYCTELLLQLQNQKTDIASFNLENVKAYLAEIGDSIVAFMTDTVVKIHVHTYTPEKVLKFCRKYGEFLTVKIENMSLQHTSVVEAEQEADKNAVEAAATPKKYGIVAVCNGAGVESLFSELGVDVVVDGGQTHNPSTNEFIDAFGKINAEHIFVFPNNGNILMAAQQAAEMYDRAEIHVLPSKNIGAGYVALSTMDLECESWQEIAESARSAMERVTTGCISIAIRDAEIHGVTIKDGDTIGIIEKEIVVSAPDRCGAAVSLADKLLADDEKFMLTVFCGKEASEGEKEVLKRHIEEKYPNDELYFIDGGQDIYSYIFVAE